MIDGKPNYTRLSTIAMADVLLLDQEGRLQFINALCEMFENVMNPDYHPAELPGLVGRSIKRQFEELQLGTRKYMTNANRNPSGLSKQGKAEPVPPEGNPMETPHGYPNGYPPGHPNRVFTREPQQEQEQEQEQDREREREQNKDTGISGGNPKASGGGQCVQRFKPPTVEEVRQYCRERNNTIDPDEFVDYYQARGWELKKGQKMKDWQASIRYWEKNQKGGQNGTKRYDRAVDIPGQCDFYGDL